MLLSKDLYYKYVVGVFNIMLTYLLSHLIMSDLFLRTQ